MKQWQKRKRGKKQQQHEIIKKKKKKKTNPRHSHSGTLPLRQGQIQTQTNTRGIPVAPFVDNVSDYVSSRAEVEPTLRSFQEMISKYQFMEVNTARRAQGLREKIPDIKKTLEMVRFLKLKRDVC